MDAESRIAIVSMIVEDTEMSAEINRILHEYRDWLVGRMGIPYKQQNVAVICVVVDAPANVTSSFSGKSACCPASASRRFTRRNNSNWNHLENFENVRSEIPQSRGVHR
ncbi:MAG: TM1266 family iron-only hydrogenase system putative regulator [Victivallis sp.]